MNEGTRPGYVEGHHWVSKFNFDPRLQEAYSFPEPLTIFDSTIRKILLTNGVRPSVDDMLRVAEALEEVGVKEIFVCVDWWGGPRPDELEYQVCKAILARGFAFRTNLAIQPLSHFESSDPFSRQVVGWREALDALRDMGMSIMQPLLDDPVTPDARARQLERLAEIMDYGRSIGVESTVAMRDAGRQDFDYVVHAANEAIRLGALRFDMVDSYSSLSPEAMRLFISDFRSRLDRQVPVTLHVHDDFGLATATAIAAVTAGAHPDVSVNGLSYRAGFASLEEVVLSLELLYGVKTGIRLDRLQWLSDTVASCSELPVHPLKAISGRYAHLRDLPGWAVAALRGGPNAFPTPGSPFAPSVVGGRLGVVWGTHHSPWVVRAKLHQMGLSGTEDQVSEIGRRIEAGISAKKEYPYWLTEEEVEEICRDVIGRRQRPNEKVA